MDRQSRSELRWFTQEMISNLDTDWNKMKPKKLITQLGRQMRELDCAVGFYQHNEENKPDEPNGYSNKVAHEAAALANLAMTIALKCRKE